MIVVLGAIAVAGALVIVVDRRTAHGVATPADARVVLVQPIDAEVVAVAAPLDAVPVIPDAPLPPPPDAAVEVHRPRPRPVPTVTAPPLAPTETHKVTINSRPWSYFTVDDAPLQHQTLEVVRLPPGPHVLHFIRDKLHKDVAITVPADDTLTVVQDMSH